jgi:hypothetical protein
VVVLTTTEAAMPGRSDEDQLRFASGKNLVLVTGNVADFARIHSQWISAGTSHAGIILIHQQRWGPGELARRIIRLLVAASGDGMRNRLEFISNWRTGG